MSQLDGEDRPDSIVGTIVFIILLLAFVLWVPHIMGLTWPWL